MDTNELDDLGIGDRAGELALVILLVLTSRRKHLYTTLEIAKKVFDDREMNTQDKYYRRVLRMLKRMQNAGWLRSYVDSQYSPRLWWLRERVVILPGGRIEEIKTAVMDTKKAAAVAD